MGGWLHTEINVRHQKLNPDTVNHPSTNRAGRRLTSLIETNTLTLRQTTTFMAREIKTRQRERGDGRKRGRGGKRIIVTRN